MQLIARLPLVWKVLLAPVVGALFFLLFLGYTMLVLGQNSARLEQVRDVTFPALDRSTENVSLLERISETLNNGVASGDAELVASTGAIAEQVRGNLDALRELDARYRQPARQLQAEFDAYYRAARSVSEAMIAGRMPEGDSIQTMMSSLETYRTNLQAFRDGNYTGFTALVEEGTEAATRAMVVGVSIAVVSLLVSILLGAAVALTVKRNVDQVVNSLRDIAQGEGDLRHRIPVTSQDEIGTLAQCFNTFVEKLHHDIQQLVETVRMLGETSGEMSQIVAGTDQAIHEEKRVIAEVGDEIRSMAQRIEQVAESASSASTAAGEADSAATSGMSYITRTIERISSLAARVDEAASTLKQLEQDSQQINVVVDVIQEVSGHTNLLALNAAIEAARAGEHGRGFAVVADEVRSMAVRTQESTSKIFEIVRQLQESTASVVEIIGTSQQEAEKTVADATGSGTTLEAITATVRTISDMNRTIAEATDDQQRASGQIDARMSELNRIAEGTASHGAQLARISQSVKGLTQNLQDVAGHFKV